jgi:peptidoglycan/xylan/chitin deacetylase (PgdA/CDA1 family)
VLQTKDGPKKMMEWADLAELSKSPLITIGSHGASHTSMTKVSPEVQDQELRESQRLIESKIDAKVRFLAYPKGDYNEEVKAAAQKYYALAFGSKGVILTFNNTDFFALPRIIMHKGMPMWKIKIMSYSWVWTVKKYYDQVKKNFWNI